MVFSRRVFLFRQEFSFSQSYRLFPSFCQALAEDRVTTPTKKKKKDLFLLVEEFYGTRYQSDSFSLINMGSGFSLPSCVVLSFLVGGHGHTKSSAQTLFRVAFYIVSV